MIIISVNLFQWLNQLQRCLFLRGFILPSPMCSLFASSDRRQRGETERKRLRAASAPCARCLAGLKYQCPWCVCVFSPYTCFSPSTHLWLPHAVPVDWPSQAAYQANPPAPACGGRSCLLAWYLRCLAPHKPNQSTCQAHAW